MKKLFISIVMLAGIYSLAFGQTPQSSGWVKIGEKSVNLSEDHGIFDFDKDREKTINANEKYSAIRFKAKDATVNLTDIIVEYEDGKKQNLSINSPVRAENESRIVNLDSKDKKLDKITFNYQKDESARADKAKVELWGLKSGVSGIGSMGQAESAGTRADRADRSMQSTRTDRSMESSDRSVLEYDFDSDAWEKIGEKTVNLSEDRGIFDFDKDREKSINANEKYSAIRFKAEDAKVNLTDIEVEYDDGKKQNLTLDSPIKADSESKVVRLESTDKKVEKIIFSYQKDESAREDKAKVELWGLKADRK
jgi:hypothetical protein